MNASKWPLQQGMVSTLVISLTSLLLIVLVAAIAAHQVGPVLCLVARTLNLPPLFV